MRYTLALIAVLALLAAGCGGGGSKKSSSTGGGSSNVKGSVSMIAVWTGAEQAAFQAVLNGFKSKYPNVKVTYQPQKDPASFLSTAVEGGKPPDLAALPAPGIIKGFVGRGLKPLDFAKSTISANYAPGWLKAATFNGKLYGLFFKGADKSTIWYNVKEFKNAGAKSSATWPQFLKSAKTIRASGWTRMFPGWGSA